MFISILFTFASTTVKIYLEFSEHELFEKMKAIVAIVSAIVGIILIFFCFALLVHFICCIQFKYIPSYILIEAHVKLFLMKISFFVGGLTGGVFFCIYYFVIA